MTYLISGCQQPLPAHSPRDLVYYLLGNTRTHIQFSVPLFMRHFAMSFFEMSGGLLLSTGDPEQFVTDLVGYGWLIEQPG